MSFPLSTPVCHQLLYDISTSWGDYFNESKNVTCLNDAYQQQILDDLILHNRIYDC